MKKKMQKAIQSKPKKEMPHKKLIPATDMKLLELQRMAKIGMTMDQIAAVHGMKKQTLYNRLKEDSQLMDAITRGRGTGIDQVTSKSFDMASSGLNTAMTIFWLRCRAGWKEPQVFELKVLHEIFGKKDIGDIELAELQLIQNATHKALKGKKDGD